MEPARFHYKFSTVVVSYIGSVGFIVFTFFCKDMPTTYFHFLKTPVGLSVFYALVAIMITITLMKTGNFLRAIAGVPIVEWDGSTLAVRDGASHKFHPSEGIEMIIREEPERNRIAIAVGSSVAHVYYSHVDGHLSLVRFLRRLQLNYAGTEI